MELFSQWIRRLCIASMYVTYVAITEGNCMTIEEMVGSNENLEKCMDYLKKYSYVDKQMDSDMVTSMDPSEVEATIRQMQRYMPNMQVTGVLDNATMEMMDHPRCGVPDPNGESDGTLRMRVRRYSHFGGRWEQLTITYRILNTSKEMDIADVRDAVRRAFDIWEKEIPRTFTEIFSGLADIEISFQEDAHGDGQPFDGMGHVLAHAFAPPEGLIHPLHGDVHFDDAEEYTLGTPEGTNLFFVAVHEIGHSIGLNHSMDTTAVMRPFYTGYEPNLRLSNDDVLGIQALYGSRPPPEVTVKPATTTERTQTTDLPSPVCQMSFDSIGYIRGEIFAFKDDRFWRVREPGNPPIEPNGILINSYFKGLPSGIQAAYERSYDQILFFKNKQYWVYDGQNPLPGYPRQITDLSKELPGNLQAAVSYDENKVYLFKRGLVYRYDENEHEVDDGWPSRIDTVFPGVPKGLDGAFRYNDGMLYFVKAKHYWRYNDLTRKVYSQQSFVDDFFGCNTDDDGMDDDGNNGGGILHFTLVFHAILLLS